MTQQDLSVNLVLKLRDFIQGFSQAKSVASESGSGIARSVEGIGTSAVDASGKLTGMGAAVAHALATIGTETSQAGKSISELRTHIANLKQQQESTTSTGLGRALQKDIQAAEKEIEKLQSEFKHAEEAGKGFFGSLKSKAHEAGESFEGIAGKLGNLGGALGGGIIGGAAFSAISSGISEIMEKAKELDDAQDGLTIALSRTTLSAEDQKKEFDALSEKSEDIANAFALPKTEVMKLQATVVGFSGITGKKLDELTELSIGASQALGMPAEAVARMIAKAADPEQEAALKRLGITFEKNATTAEKMAIVQAKLGPSIKAAKDAANDGIGGFERLKETVEDAVINLAGGIVESLKPVFDILSAILGPILKLGGAILKLALEFNPLALIMKAVHAVAEALHPVWVKITEAFERLKPTFATVGHMFSELWNSVKGIGEALMHAVKQLFGFGEGAKSSSGFMDKLGQAIQFVADIIEATVRGIQGTVNVVKLIVDTISNALQNFDILHPGKMLAAFDGFGEKAKAAFNSGFARTDTPAAEPERPEGDDKKEKAPKEKSGTTRTLLQDVQDYIKQQKALEDADHQTIEATAKNFEVRRAQLQAERENKEQHIAATIKDAKKRNEALAKLDAEQIEAEAALKDAAEQQRSKEADLRNKAGLENAESVDAQLSAVRKKYEDQNKALRILLQKQIIDQQQYDTAMANHTKLSEEDMLRVKMDAIEKQAKVKADSDKKEFDAQIKSAKTTASLLGVSVIAIQEGLTRRYAEQQKQASLTLEQQEVDAATASITNEAERAKTIQGIRAKFSADRLANAEATKEALDKIEQSRIDREKDTAVQRAQIEAYEKDGDLDSLNYKLSLIDIETQHEIDSLRLRLGATKEFENAKKLVLLKAQDDRDKLERDALQKDNQLYKSAAVAIESTFSSLNSKLKGIIDGFFTHESDAQKKASATDLALKKLELEKKKKQYLEDIQNSKISREEGLLQIQKLEEDAKAQEEGEAKDHQTVLQTIGQQTADATIDNLTKVGESYVEMELQKMMLQKASATGDLITSIFGAVPFPANIAIAAGAFGIVSALFSTILGSAKSAKPKGAAKGLVHRPGEDGAHGQMIAIGETGEEEFASPRETAHDYFVKDFGPKLAKDMRPQFERAILNNMPFHQIEAYKTFQTQGFIPHISPALTMERKSSTSKLEAVLERHEKLLTHLSTNGIPVQVTGESRLENDHIKTAYENATKAQNNRFKTNGGGTGR